MRYDVGMAEYECWNPSCPRYAGKGTVLRASAVYADNENYLRCRSCRQYVKRRAGGQGEEAARPVAGAAGGALLGWAMGGPAGAIVGGLLGLVLGAAAEANRESS